MKLPTTSSVTFPTLRQASSMIAIIPLWACSTKSQMIWLLKYSMFCQAIPSFRYSSCSCFRTNSDKIFDYESYVSQFEVFSYIPSIILTNKKLLQLFVAIINTKLFEAIYVKNFEAIDIKHADQRSVSLHIIITVIYVDRSIDAWHYPREQSLVYSLKDSYKFLSIHVIKS